MEMKKYMTPEMEVVEMKYQTSLLAGSDGDGSSILDGGSGNPDDPDDDPA